MEKNKKQKEEPVAYLQIVSLSFSKTFATDPTNTAFQTVPEQKQLHCQPVIGGDALLGQQQYLATLEGAADVNAFPEQLEYPLKGAEGGACDEQLAEQFLQIMNQTNNGDRFSEFSVVLRQWHRCGPKLSFKAASPTVMTSVTKTSDLNTKHEIYPDISDN